MNFLVCQECDGGDLDRRVIDSAMRNARTMGASVIIVNSQLVDDRFHNETIESVERHLAAVRKEMQQAGVACRSHLSVRGLAAGEDLVKVAEENEAEEIYIGIKKRSRLGKLLLGSTTQHLLLMSSRTVVAIK